MTTSISFFLFFLVSSLSLLLSLFPSSTVTFVVDAKEIYLSNAYNELSCESDYHCPSLAQAVNITESNDVIYVYPGNYGGHENLDICVDRYCDFRNVSLIGLGQPDQVVFDGNATTITRAIYISNSSFTYLRNLTYNGVQNLTYIMDQTGFSGVESVSDDIVIAGAAILITAARVFLENIIFINNAGVAGIV
jgi:hypothetical protein